MVFILYIIVDDIQCYWVCFLFVVKGVSYECVMVEFGKLLEDFVDLNFYVIMLILVDCDFILYDILVVCEYFDECYLYFLLMLIDLFLWVWLCLVVVCIECDWLLEVDIICVGG